MSENTKLYDVEWTRDGFSTRDTTQKVSDVIDILAQAEPGDGIEIYVKKVDD